MWLKQPGSEMYNNLESKTKRTDFFATEKKFRKDVLTEGSVQLVQQYPSSKHEFVSHFGRRSL
jgi:hypothetical protein